MTNPDALSIPEEILLNATSGYTIVRPSNQVTNGGQVLSEEHINELRSYLTMIHNKFRGLYDVDSEEDFAMEIEYKITSEGKLAIKQARPWIFPSLP